MGILGLLGIALANISHAISSTGAKVAVLQASPLFCVALRTIIAGPTLLLFYKLIDSKPLLRRVYKYRFHIVLGAFTRILIPSTLLYWSVRHMYLGKAALFGNFKPFITYVLSTLILSECMSTRKWVGVFIGISGIIPIMIAREPVAEQTYQLAGFISLPEIAMMCAYICVSYGWIKLRQFLINKPDISVFFVTGAESLVAGLIGLTAYLCVWGIPTIAQPQVFIGAISVALIAGTLVRRTVKVWLLKNYSPTLISLAELTYPFLAAFAGWLWFNETIGHELYLSTAIVCVGFYIFVQDACESCLCEGDE